MTALVRADSVAIPLRDGCVDLVVTSPPYFALRSYQDGGEHYDGQIGSEASPRDFLEALWAVTRECVRVLKPTGSIFVNLGDKYAGSGGHNNSAISAKSTLQGNGHIGGGPKIKATRRSAPDRYNQAADVRAKSLMGLPWLYALGCTGALAALGGPDPGLDLILRSEIVWDKPNGLPESVTDRVRRSHEQWFHFTKSPTYFAAMDEVRQPHAPWTLKAYAYEQAATEKAGGYNRRANNDRVDQGDASQYAVANPLGKIPGSVWRIASEPLVVPEYVDVDHFAAFPQEFPRRFILGWSPSGYCTACGEPRRATVDKTLIERNRNDAPLKYRGYACPCPDTSAPTRPAVVLDPFVGTGTVVGVARMLGRYGIGIDLSADYLRLAQWRINDSGNFAKSVSRTHRENQGVLL